MIGLLQRVTQAEVLVNGETLAAIGRGLFVLVGVERGDTERQAERLAERLLGYRVFDDAGGRMNRSLIDVGGDLLLVPQFTLPADTRKGMRPSFTPAADPALGDRLFGALEDAARRSRLNVRSGRFGAHMQIRLVNDGPVTFWLRAKPESPEAAGGRPGAPDP
jgi:D-tyrosyl-tRNA(Tyr) deacylase